MLHANRPKYKQRLQVSNKINFKTMSSQKREQSDELFISKECMF